VTKSQLQILTEQVYVQATEGKVGQHKELDPLETLFRMKRLPKEVDK